MRGSLKYTNEELVEGVRNKDNLILQYIIKQNIKPFRQLVLKNNGSETDAHDLLQEVIIVLFRKVAEDNFKLTSSLGTFMYSIGRLIWLKELENRRTKYAASELVEVLDESDSIYEVIEKSERLRLYREKFEELGEDCKKVLRLFYLGTPMAQITKFMGYSSNDYTKKRKYACKNALVSKIKSSKQFRELGNENN